MNLLIAFIAGMILGSLVNQAAHLFLEESDAEALIDAYASGLMDAGAVVADSPSGIDRETALELAQEWLWTREQGQ